MLPPLRRLLPVLLLLLLAQLNTCSAALASNPGDFNVVTCGADKGITPDCTARISTTELRALRAIRMRLKLFIRDQSGREEVPLTMAYEGIEEEGWTPEVSGTLAEQDVWESEEGGPATEDYTYFADIRRRPDSAGMQHPALRMLDREAYTPDGVAGRKEMRRSRWRGKKVEPLDLDAWYAGTPMSMGRR